jgi:REP element-mobilizing transposase RayT
VYRCHHHVSWCPKYRRKVTGGATLELIKKYVENQRNV